MIPLQSLLPISDLGAIHEPPGHCYVELGGADGDVEPCYQYYGADASLDAINTASDHVQGQTLDFDLFRIYGPPNTSGDGATAP